MTVDLDLDVSVDVDLDLDVDLATIETVTCIVRSLLSSSVHFFS